MHEMENAIHTKNSEFVTYGMAIIVECNVKLAWRTKWIDICSGTGELWRMHTRRLRQTKHTRQVLGEGVEALEAGFRFQFKIEVQSQTRFRVFVFDSRLIGSDYR